MHPTCKILLWQPNQIEKDDKFYVIKIVLIKGNKEASISYCPVIRQH
jgi:hypothetical protein